MSVVVDSVSVTIQYQLFPEAGHQVYCPGRAHLGRRVIDKGSRRTVAPVGPKVDVSFKASPFQRVPGTQRVSDLLTMSNSS